MCLLKHDGYESLVTWQQEPTHRSKYKYLKRAASQMAVLICGGLCDSGVGFIAVLYVQIHNMSKRGSFGLLPLRSVSDLLSTQLKGVYHKSKTMFKKICIETEL